MLPSVAQGSTGSKRDSIAGVFLLMTLLMAFTSLALAVSGATTHAQRNSIGAWPTATTTVTQCSVEQHLSLRRGNDLQSYSARCDVSYSVNGSALQGRVDSKSIDAGSNGNVYSLSGFSIVTRRPQRELNSWVDHHPRGSALTLHYDPADPKNLTFVGAGSPVDFDPGPSSLQGVALFALIGLVLWVVRRSVLKSPG